MTQCKTIVSLDVISIIRYWFTLKLYHKLFVLYISSLFLKLLQFVIYILLHYDFYKNIVLQLSIIVYIMDYCIAMWPTWFNPNSSTWINFCLAILNEISCVCDLFPRIKMCEKKTKKNNQSFQKYYVVYIIKHLAVCFYRTLNRFAVSIRVY